MRSLLQWLGDHEATFPAQKGPKLGTGQYRKLHENTFTQAREQLSRVPAEVIQEGRGRALAELVVELYLSGALDTDEPFMLSEEQVSEPAFDAVVTRFRIEHA